MHVFRACVQRVANDRDILSIEGDIVDTKAGRSAHDCCQVTLDTMIASYHDHQTCARQHSPPRIALHQTELKKLDTKDRAGFLCIGCDTLDTSLQTEKVTSYCDILLQHQRNSPGKLSVAVRLPLAPAS